MLETLYNLRYLEKEDPRFRILLELLTELIFSKHEMEEVLMGCGILPGNYDLSIPRHGWHAIILDAIPDGRLQKLITEAIRTRPAIKKELNNRLIASEKEYAHQKVWYQNTDPINCKFVGRGATRAIVDREQLRRHLRDLSSGMYKVLLVEGGPRSGKSHTWRLIEHLMTAGPPAGLPMFSAVKVSIHSLGTQVNAGEIMGTLADRLGLDLNLAASSEMPDARTRKMVDRFIGQLPDDGKIRWIVIDGLDRPGVDPDCVDLARRLVSVIEEGELPNTRLVITGLPEGDSIGSRFVLYETIKEIKEDDIERFIRGVAEDIKKPINSPTVEQIVREILPEVESPGPPRFGRSRIKDL